MKQVVTFGYDKRFNNRMKNRLEKMKIDKKFIKLNEFGQEGVDRLQAATPVRTGKTANSWFYKIEKKNGNEVSITWYNTNINDYVNIAVILDTGHATANGNWVQGYNYIGPAINPVLEEIKKYFREEG